MKKTSSLLSRLPALLSSKVSIFIYLFLFAYLVIYALLCTFVPALNGYAPSDATQLIMGNYTNVLSALGASIAAGAGSSVHSSLKKLHEKHDKMQDTINVLHAKIDALDKKL